MIKVFISYAREDSEVASRLFDDLQIAGASPWIDSQNLIPGQDWKSEIRKAIQSSDFLITLFSERSASKKGFFQKEVRLALSELEKMPPDKILLIPCRIDDVNIPYEPLRDLHWLDLFPSYAEGLKRLTIALGLKDPDSFNTTDYRDLMRQMDQNLLKYKLAQTNTVLNQPFLFSRPNWTSSISLNSAKTLRRLYETIARIQKTIPLYNYELSERGNNTFFLRFKHDAPYAEFSKQLEQQLLSEGVRPIETQTRKNEIPKGHSVAILAGGGEVMIRGSTGRTVLVTAHGAYDSTTGQPVSQEELKILSPGGGYSIGNSNEGK